MNHSSRKRLCLPPRDGAGTYAPPELLAPLHILDLLELCGSQAQAALALAIHQSTVSRSVAMLAEQFRLQSRPADSLCRYDGNESLQHLRLCYRAHRRMAGLLRIATDPLHQGLLADLPMVQTVPPRLRGTGDWVHLLDQALIDGAIVSSWCHPERISGERPPRWRGTITVPLGVLPLRLVCAAAGSAAGAPRTVMVPCRSVAPLLQASLKSHGFLVDEQPSNRQDSRDWLERLHQRRLALPLCLWLLDPGWIDAQGLVPHPERPPLQEQLWLLLPAGRLGGSREARRLIRVLRRRLWLLQNRGGQHG